jgi:hypothetical protein
MLDEHPSELRMRRAKGGRAFGVGPASAHERSEAGMTMACPCPLPRHDVDRPLDTVVAFHIEVDSSASSAGLCLDLTRANGEPTPSSDDNALPGLLIEPLEHPVWHAGTSSPCPERSVGKAPEP